MTISFRGKTLTRDIFLFVVSKFYPTDGLYDIQVNCAVVRIVVDGTRVVAVRNHYHRHRVVSSGTNNGQGKKISDE